MLRLILWGVLAYLAYRAYTVIKDSFIAEDDSKVDGKPESPKFDISEDDIEDAEFKDINDK